MFGVIGYKENENSKARTIPDFHAEAQRFRVELRRSQFLDPRKDINAFNSLNGDKLSEEMKIFSDLAEEKRKTFLKEVLLKQIATDPWLPIPITDQEAEAQRNEENMNKKQLVAIINSILISLPESQCPKFSSLNYKSKTELLEILQEIRELHNNNEEIVPEKLTDNNND